MLIESFSLRRNPVAQFLMLVIVSCLTNSASELQGSDSESSSHITGGIRFNERDFVVGRLAGFHTGETLLWSCPDFLEPLHINVEDIGQLTNRSEKFYTFRHPPGSVRVDMVDGDVVFGKVVRTDASTLTIESMTFGTIEIPSGRWRQYSTVDATGLIDSQPVSRVLGEMVDIAQLPSGWESVFDGFSTLQRSATLRKDFNLGGRFRVDLRIAWTGKPSFDIAMGIDPNEPSASTAVHLEVWDGILVLAKQEDGKADTAAICDLSKMFSRIELVILHDSSTGVTIAQNTQGVELARITLPSSRSRRCSGIQIVNHGESLRIESLRSDRWPEDDLQREKKSEVVRNEFASNASSELPVTNVRPTADLVSIEAIDGSRLRGRFENYNSADSSVSFSANGIVQPILLQVDDIHRIYRNSFFAVQTGSLKLSTDHVALDVDIESFRRSLENELLRVRSPYFERPATLAVGANGFILDRSSQNKYEEARLKSGTKQNAILVPSGAVSQAIDFRIPSAIVMRTGEILHGDVQSIDEDGLRFSSKFTDGSLLKREELQSVFLRPRLHPVPLDTNKVLRLLTVPRNQSDSVPQNLLITTSGDYIRGTVIRLSNKVVDYAVKEETLRIPRGSVSSIVWIREPSNEIDQPSKAEEITSATDNRVLVEFIDDKPYEPGLMTLAIDAVENNVMTGRNPLLGEVELPESDITSIAFGATSMKSKKQSKNPWIVNIAKSPTTWEQNGDSNESSGLGGDSSPLIGLQAPPFLLVDLMGEPVRLDQYRGKVVVLDFWASWCGPCMESLPEVYRIANSFGDRCQWLGINLQESQEQAVKIANRLGIERSILLDSDGKVASLYDASAIPLVIVIAPDGIVQRVFMGMQRSRLESLRSAIEANVTQ